MYNPKLQNKWRQQLKLWYYNREDDVSNDIRKDYNSYDTRKDVSYDTRKSMQHIDVCTSTRIESASNICILAEYKQAIELIPLTQQFFKQQQLQITFIPE